MTSPSAPTTACDPGTFIIYERYEQRELLDTHLGAPRMRELVPQMLELIDGSIEDGIRLQEGDHRVGAVHRSQ
ncbi:putative quinol monooxygenase [Rhodococcus gordoniae]